MAFRSLNGRAESRPADFQKDGSCGTIFMLDEMKSVILVIKYFREFTFASSFRFTVNSEKSLNP